MNEEDRIISIRLPPNLAKLMEDTKKRTGLNSSQIIKNCFLQYAKTMTEDHKLIVLLEEKEKQAIAREKTKHMLKKETHAHEVRKLLKRMAEDNIKPSKELIEQLLEEAETIGTKEQVEKILKRFLE